MREQKSVVSAVGDIVLTDVQSYLLTRMLTFRHRFTVSHRGLPFEFAFERLEDAEKFFRVEVQSRGSARR